jgi:hypothetical protein
MDEEEYTGRNPWHEAVHLGRGLSCARCRLFFQGEEAWRDAFLPWDHHRWCVLVARDARVRGWKRLRGDGFLCPRCAARRERRTRGGQAE